MVKQGYKQTEVGVIPEDWDCTTWESVGDGFTSGATPYRAIKSFYKGNLKWVTSGELNYNTIYETIEHISEEARIRTNLKIHPKDTFLMAITGLEAAGTRGSCAILGTPATTNQSCMAIYPTDKLDTKYLFYYYSKYGDDLAFKYCQGTKQQSYTARIVKILPIIIPKIEEQMVIAEALSEVDGMISSLEKLIAKKKAVKQGAMQELLTGKKRLSRFSGEWINKKIEEIAEVGRGRVISHIEISKNLGGKYPVYSSQTTNNGIMGYLRTFDFDGDYITWTTDGVNAGTVFYRNGKFNCTNVCGTLKCKKDNADFVARRLGIETPKYVATNLANPKLMNDVMKKITITLPPTIEEQNAIATILSDMDNEIEALEQKLAKTRQLKQGMMQQLLTGKIRLV